MKNNLTFLERTTLRPKNKIVFGVFSAALLTCSAVGAGSVDVSVLTGQSCPGENGGGITTHRTLSVGGYPDAPFFTSAYDEFSVSQDSYQYACVHAFDWLCNWEMKSSEETPWGPPPNSFLNRIFAFTNFRLILETRYSYTWGKAYYWSANQQKEFWTPWNGSMDHC